MALIAHFRSRPWELGCGCAVVSLGGVVFRAGIIDNFVVYGAICGFRRFFLVIVAIEILNRLKLLQIVHIA